MEEEKNVLSIVVTNEQKRVIEAHFGHYNWDFIEGSENNVEQISTSNQHQSANDNVVVPERSDEDADDDVEESEEVQSDEETDHDMCSDCFLSPCVTTSRQSWLGNGSGLMRKTGI